jgi:signal transduction histidine kinase
VLTVDDDGCGMEEVRESGGMGLQIMDFRAKMIGSNLKIRSQKGEGTLVQVVLAPPIDEPLDDNAHREDVSR